MAQRTLLLQDEFVSGDVLYRKPTGIQPAQSIYAISTTVSFNWSYGGFSGTFTSSSFTANFNANNAYSNPNVPVYVYFPLDETITIGNAKYKPSFIIRYKGNTSEPDIEYFDWPASPGSYVRVEIPYSAGFWHIPILVCGKYDTYKRINFNANGGTVSPSYIEGWGGDTITLPTPTYDSEHVFKGWYTGSTRVGGGGDSWTVPNGTSNLTLTAHWNISESGIIEARCIRQIYQIGTYTYTQDNDAHTASLSWNITRQSVVEDGRTFVFHGLRIYYYAYGESVPSLWETNQTSGTFDRTSITPRPTVISRPPDASMGYWLDDLLYTALGWESGRLIYSRANGALCYGPYNYTGWYPGNSQS